MTETAENSKNSTHQKNVKNYYRYHAPIYDATRWSFLFGRETILDMIPEIPVQSRILDIGCGTGKNIEHLATCYPDGQILGIDLSEAMLDVAQTKFRDFSQQIRLLNIQYGTQSLNEDPFDLVLLSYALTMAGEQIEDILEQIISDLKPTGYIAVVDFHTSPFRWFQRWMRTNHVDLSGSTLPLLKKYFDPVNIKINQAYGGLWSYFFFIGRK